MNESKFVKFVETALRKDIMMPDKIFGYMWPFIWKKKLESSPPKPRMLCAKFGWKWLSGSGEEDF